MENLINWQESYSVGVTEIDNQHRRIIDIINALYQNFIQKSDIDSIAEIIKKLEEYASLHFRTEELYFTKFNYPGSIAHIAEHRSFTHQVHEFKNMLKTDPKNLVIKMMPFLKDWLVKHIAFEDKKYSECFKMNGLE